LRLFSLFFGDVSTESCRVDPFAILSLFIRRYNLNATHQSMIQILINDAIGAAIINMQSSLSLATDLFGVFFS
jgi:hypothetical protein